MKNVDVKVENDVLVIRISLKKEFGPSKSGKTIIVATTAGNQEVPGTNGLRLGLNAYRKAVATK